MRDPWTEPRRVGLVGQVGVGRVGKNGGGKMETAVFKHQ